MSSRHVAAVPAIGKYSLLASQFILFLKKTFLSLCFSICVVFSTVFPVLVKLCDFVMFACEDTAPLKFGGVVFLSAGVYACIVCCVFCEALLSNICVWI